MDVTFVKKITSEGKPCRKCAEVEERLRAAGLTDRIGRVVIADERDPDSEGMRLAAELGVASAPFFIVVQGGRRVVYTSYVQLLKEVLQASPTEEEEAVELARRDDVDLY
jgi:hypothetical protein